MSYPKVTITEYKDGPRPIRSRSFARAACIGVAAKGKFNAFTLVSTDEELEQKIGKDLNVGSVGLQAARDEGAVDQAFVRVMGAARKASGFVTLAGTGTISDTVTLRIINTEPVTPVTTNYTTSLNVGETFTQIVSELAALVAADANSLLLVTVDGSTPGKLILIAKTAGLAGNQISYQIIEGSDVEDDITATPSTATFLTGGEDGPALATVTVDDYRIDAAFEGVGGNAITYKFIPGASARLATLELTDGDGVVERHLIEFTTPNLINSNEFLKLRSSFMVRMYYTGGDLSAAALPTGTGSLSGGTDGSTITEDDYIEALSVLGANQANIIYVPGQSSDAIRAAILAQAENSTILGGLRVGVLNATRGMSLTAAPDEAEIFNTATGSAVMVAGWATYAGQPRLAELSVSPDGFYAGKLAATKLHVSPAARTSSGYFKTVLATDTTSNEVAFDIYTNARLEAIIIDPDTGGFACLNGRTLSSDVAEYYVCIRRMANKIKTDIYFGSQALKAEPKTEGLLSSIKGMVEKYFEGLSAVGEINSGTVETIRKTGTGTRCDYRWYPIYPADEIDYGQHRDAIEQL